jgi:hypothetical protein
MNLQGGHPLKREMEAITIEISKWLFSPINRVETSFIAMGPTPLNVLKGWRIWVATRQASKGSQSPSGPVLATFYQVLQLSMLLALLSGYMLIYMAWYFLRTSCFIKFPAFIFLF